MVALERPVPRMISVSERPILLAATISRISAYLARIPRGLFRLSLGNVMFQIVKTVFDLIVYRMRVTSRKGPTLRARHGDTRYERAKPRQGAAGYFFGG